MKRRTALFAIVAVLTTSFAAGGPLAAQTGSELEGRIGPERMTGTVSDDFDLRSPDHLIHVFIQLNEPSVAEFAAETGAGAAAQQSQGRAVLAQQSSLRSALGDLIAEERSNLVVGANGLRAMVRVGDLPAIRATEGVESVAPVTLFELDNDTSVPWIGGETVRGAGYDGTGVSIAVIDTGIDYTHSALGGSGDPDDYANNDRGVVEAGSFPTTKVVGGFDFAGRTYDASDPDLDTPSPDPDPLDANGHGTHVAATAAGIDDGDTDDVGTGMAPAANLYAYKVFGDVAGSTALVSDALELALDPNNDLNIEDAVDVVNMSLGSPFGHPGDPSAIASQNAVDNGVVVVASSGNSGPVPYVTGSPAVADGVISVAASADDGVEVLGIEVTFPGEAPETFEAQPGDFGDLSAPGLSGEMAAATPLDACTQITNDVSGKIALIQRGICTFTTKVRNAENQGAIGVIVFNNTDDPPIAMAHDGTEPRPDIPAVMVSQADGEAIAAAVDGAGEGEVVEATLSDAITIPKPELTDTMAGFTSRGPGFGNVFKPDLSGPGFSIDSADVGSGTGAALSSGTSMAAPHIAGAAAQLLESNEGLTPAQVKALLMNSATPANIPGEPDGEFVPGAVPIASQGTGIAHVDRAAIDLEGYATPGGLAFSFNPTEATSQTATVEITRLDGEATYDVEVLPNQTLDGVDWTASDNQIATSSGEASVDVTVDVDPSALASDDGDFSQAESDGWLVLSNVGNPADEIVVGLVAVADPASTVLADGGVETVAVANDGPGDGFADGFTYLTDGSGSLESVGFRTGFVPEEAGGPYGTIDFGVALSEVWSSPSALEIDIFLDVDEDGNDDYALVAADLGILQGADPTGQVVTALFDLSEEGGVLLYFALGDLNDRVITLPADLTGDFGFLEENDTSFDMTVVVFDQLGAAGTSDTVTVELGTEITAADGLSLAIPAGAAGDVSMEGEGEMLWLFQNNPAPTQATTTTVALAEPPPEEPPPEEEPPEEEPPSFNDVPEAHLFHAEIIWLAEQGITRGCNPPDNTLFCPEDTVTRGQMAAFLNRALLLDATTVDFFADDDASVFEGDINRLAAADITRGCNPPSNDEFCPGLDLTRAEMATFMVRGFGFSAGSGADLFVDDDANIHESAIDRLGTADVTRGCNPPTNDMFCPDQDMTRGQMAAFIYRAFQAAGLDG